jgi:hypothetical protein
VSTTNSTSVTTTEAADDRLREASRRLADRTAAICGRLEAELGRAQAELEIDWRALLASQREVAEQASKGSAPVADVFWDHQAQPQAEGLLTACLSSIDAHLVLLWDALSSYWQAIDPMLDDDRARQAARDDVERLVAPLRDCGLDRTPLDDLGERWQHRLRRQAIRRFVRTGGSTDEGFSAAIDAQELQMITQPPWAQADQLLSAFELVHSDVRRAITEKVDRIVDDVLAG